MTPTCGEEALGEDYECVGEMGVGWGVWSWSIVLANIKECEKGLTCALLRGCGKVLDWDLAFAWRVRGW